MATDFLGLQNRLVLITGGTRGIGRAVAERFAAAGARVALTSRHGDQAERVARSVQARFGGRARGFACDVSDLAQVRALFRELHVWNRQPLHVLANVAGHPVEPHLWDVPLHRMRPVDLVEGHRRVYATDLAGARYCTYYALREMVKARAGSLVYVSSTPALVGYKGTPYTEAKAGLLGLTRDVAREYGPRGIRANAIAPGNIRTDWLKHVSATERRRLERENPLQRFGEPREVADLVLFLGSRMSSFITGQTIVVDGGTVSH